MKAFTRYSEAEIGFPVTYVYSKAEAKALLRGFDTCQIRQAISFPIESTSTYSTSISGYGTSGGSPSGCFGDSSGCWVGTC